MDIHTNIPLKNYTTMKLGGPARFFADAHSNEELRALVLNAKTQQVPIFVLGGGSNVIAKDEGFAGLVIRMRSEGFTVIADDLNTTTITVAAGEIWDETVRKTVEMRLSGIETLSGIPGTTGAAPVQNIGAYGQELADTFQHLEAYDITNDTFVTLTAEECGFGYRHSIFRGSEQGRYIITAVTLQLSKNLPTPPFYDSLQTYLDEHNITIHTQQSIRDAVLAIRTDKLPNPIERPNSGSFFKNTIVEKWQLDDIKKTHPDVRNYDMGNGTYKIPTGWLIESAGLKGQVLYGMRVHDKNTLVLINESATSYADLAKARDRIIGDVRDTFRVVIEQEPLEI